MESETILSRDLRVADDKAQYDASCKRILSEKRILAWIMKSCLEEYRDYDVKEIAEQYIEGTPQVGEVPVAPDEAGPLIQGGSTEDKTVHEGTVTFDIRFYAIIPDTKEQIGMIVNVESQFRYNPGYPLTKRGIYYCSRMISSQYGREFTKSHYERIKKCTSIWVCSRPPKDRANTITRYAMQEENLVGRVREPAENYDLLSVVMICLGRPEDSEEGSVLRLLDVLLSREAGHAEKRRVLQEDFDIPMSETLDEEVSQMCNLSQGVWEDGLEEGMKKGMEKGRVDALKNLMDALKLPLEQAMAILKIPSEELPKYQELLAVRS